MPTLPSKKCTTASSAPKIKWTTSSPPTASLLEKDFQKLREPGFPDGEILEINQVANYFNYANRTVLGLGVNIDGDIPGLSPNDSSDPNNWSHS